MGKRAFALQYASPNVEPVFAAAVLLRQVFAIARADQRGRILGNIERLSQVLVVDRLSVAKLAQETQSKLAQAGEAVGILVEVAEHVIVLGAKIIVAAIFGKNERIEEQAISIGGNLAGQRFREARFSQGRFAQQRTPGTAQGFFFDFPKQAK